MSNELKAYYVARLVAAAIARHGHDVVPVRGFKNFRDGLTVMDGHVMLWYNDQVGSTYIVRQPLEARHA